MRDSLRALLASIPLSGAVGVDDAASALLRLQDCRPALLLIDLDPADPMVWPLLDEAKRKQPRIRHLFLVDTMEQQQAALRAGANVALLKGFPASRLAGVIRGLLPKTDRERAPYLSLEVAQPW